MGDATTTDILDAEYERVDATLRNINAKIDLRIANLKMLNATGRLEPIATEGVAVDDLSCAGPSWPIGCLCAPYISLRISAC